MFAVCCKVLHPWENRHAAQVVAMLPIKEKSVYGNLICCRCVEDYLVQHLTRSSTYWINKNIKTEHNRLSNIFCSSNGWEKGKRSLWEEKFTSIRTHLKPFASISLVSLAPIVFDSEQQLKGNPYDYGRHSKSYVQFNFIDGKKNRKKVADVVRPYGHNNMVQMGNHW